MSSARELTESAPLTPRPDLGPDPYLGRVLDGRYRLEQRIGEGGMGAVYAGRHVKLGRRVAIKLIHDELSGRPEVVARFEREVEANARLEHPHIANAVDCGTEDGATYLVMRLVEGKSLRDLIDEGPIEVAEACEIGAQIADALAAAHAAGVIHRDLKPSNVILEPRDGTVGHVRVLDFGIASLVDERGAEAGLTREGHIVGTVGYMAPEQALAREVTPASDLYALGVLLWEMIVGERLFERTELTVSTYIVRQLTEPPRPLAGVPPALSELVLGLLRSDVAEREGSATAVRDRLRALASEPAPTPAKTPPTIAPPPVGPRPDPSPTAKPGARAALGPLAALVVGAIALLGALGSATPAPSSKARVTKGKSARAPAPPLPVAPTAPDPLTLALDALVLPDEDWRARREAARALLAHEDRVTPFAAEAARIEIAASCEVRVRAARALAASGDPRAEGILRRRRRDRCRALRRAIEEELGELRR